MIKILILLFSFSSIASYSKLEKFLFHQNNPNIVTEQFLLFHDGEVRFEKFEKGSRETRHLLWSMSKSIGSLLFGIAEQKGYISKSDLISNIFKEELNKLPKSLQNKHKNLKVKNLLEMSSGLNWNEFYESSPFNSHVVRMLYFAAKESVVDYILQVPYRHTPGEKFYYSSGDSNLLMGALQKKLPKNLKQIFPWKFLFDPLEMDATFETDKKGVFMASSYAYLSTKDLLKLGLFILNKGSYKGKQIVSKEYIDYATSISEAFAIHKDCKNKHNLSYGAQFWLNRSCDKNNKFMPDAPEELVMLLGHGGQSVYIFPSERIVAVRIARDKHNALDKNTYSKYILNAVKNAKE